VTGRAANFSAERMAGPVWPCRFGSRYRASHRSLPRSAAMRVLPLVALMGLLQGCYDSAGQFTTEEPQASNVVGRYTLNRKCVVNLAPDGTFTATNAPPVLVPTGSETLSCLVTSSGTWRIERVVLNREAGPCWRVVLNSQGAAVSSPMLVGIRPNALRFTSEESEHKETVMTFTREK
jgi:hypothetical protein